MLQKALYKYRLKERMAMLSYDEYRLAMKAIPKALEISQRTFHRYIYTRLHEKYSMPGDHLARLASFFNCRMEDLLNFNPPPITMKGIYKSKNELANKIGLVK